MIRQVSHLAWKKHYYFLTFMSLLCCVFDSLHPAGAVVCYSPVTVTNSHTLSNIQLLTYLSGASSYFSNLWVLRKTRSCLDLIPEAVLFCFGNSPVCLEVSLFQAPPAPSSFTQCISAACEHKGLFGGFLMAPRGTEVIDINVKLLICSWGIVCKLT